MSSSNLLRCLLFIGAFAIGCSSSSGGTTPGPDSAPADTAKEAELDTTDLDTNKPDVLGTCTTCRDANCKAESIACAGDDACKARVACLNGCTDAACQKACTDANPSATADAYVGCLKDKCTAECSK